MTTIVIVGDPTWADEIATRLEDSLRLTARSGYVARLAEARAALVLVDGGDDGWQFWTSAPKSSPATRRIPILFVSDDAGRRAEGLTAGADVALRVDELRARLAELVAAWARVQDAESQAEMEAGCGEALPAEALEAVAYFNAGEYYKQHDAFEALWMAETRPVRDLYRAVLQVGVAYYQVTRGNQRGALKMLLRSLQWLALLPDSCQGIDVAALRADAAAVRAELERVGADGMAEFDRALLKPLRLAPAPSDGG
jgi:hypothetical protein